MDQTVEKLALEEAALVRNFIETASDIPGLSIFGPQTPRHRIGVFSVRVEGYDPQELSAILEGHYGILTRSGIHCAPLAHAAIGTADQGGTTRLSFGPFVTRQDVKEATAALSEIATGATVSR
jgi:selenocysteine lyase/cysteine desulfurase